MTGYVLRDIIRRQGRRARRLTRQEADTMTEHDTTAHVAAIKATTAHLRGQTRITEGDHGYLTWIDQHADALADRLAAAEAERDAERVRAQDQEQVSGRIFRELMDMQFADSDVERRAIFVRASAVLNGHEPPQSDLDAVDVPNEDGSNDDA